jgi:hypothetical protein
VHRRRDRRTYQRLYWRSLYRTLGRSVRFQQAIDGWLRHGRDQNPQASAHLRARQRLLGQASRLSDALHDLAFPQDDQS